MYMKEINYYYYYYYIIIIVIIIIIKLCHNLLPTNVAVQIRHDHKGQNMSKEHKYQTRNKYIPNLPQVYNNKYKSSFLFCAIREYSVLNSELKRSPTLKSFVCRCKKYLLLE